MKATEIKNVKKSEFFCLTNNVKHDEDGQVLAKYVYVRDEYNRSEKKFDAYKFCDINDWKLLKGDRIVYVDFYF